MRISIYLENKTTLKFVDKFKYIDRFDMIYDLKTSSVSPKSPPLVES